MQRILFILLITYVMGDNKLAIGSNQSYPDTNFIYLFDKVVPLELLSDFYIIKLNSESGEVDSTLFNEDLIYKYSINYNTIVVISNTHYLTTLVSNNTIYTFQPLYKYSISNNEVVDTPQFLYYTDELLVKPIAGYDTQLENRLIEMGCTVDKNEATEWLVKVPRESQTVVISRKIYELDIVEYSYPNRFIQIQHCAIPNDEYFNKQFYLHNTGQQINFFMNGTPDADIDAPEAWEITKGNPNIFIAIIDEGITSEHPDLPSSRQIRPAFSNKAVLQNTERNTVVTSAHPKGVDNTKPNWNNEHDPSPNLFLDANHGNACAGIAAASHNNQGIAGIAPESKIMAIKIPFTVNMPSGTSINENKFSQAIALAQANNADVISCSWIALGLVDGSPTIKTAITNAITSGRNGKGCVVVFAAGNFTKNNFPGPPSNENIPGLICVGASDRNDNRTPYSPIGKPMDIVAPSGVSTVVNVNGTPTKVDEIWTIDIPGSSGFNPFKIIGEPNLGMVLPSTGVNSNSYTGLFSGTSAACPQVAGVAALLLSINPCLTSLEVETILKKNADKVGTGISYNWNAGGHSQEMGYGRLNAFNALRDLTVVQNINLTNFTSRKAGTFIIGSNVANFIPSGPVVVKSNSTANYRAILGITMEEGFYTEDNSTFTAEILDAGSSCTVWNEAQMTMLNQQALLSSGKRNPNDIIRPDLETSPESIPLDEVLNEYVKKIRIYPNPANDKLIRIELTDLSSSTPALLTILDSAGKTVLEQNLNNALIHYINISSLNTGIYFVLVNDGKNIEKSRISIIK